jgi:peptidoglycan/xylan/chitin deacetylase (PgdA/CDA1 family)
MLKSIKRKVLSASETVGAPAILRRSEWRRRRLAILCYHGVSMADEHEWDPRLYVSPELLRRRMQILRDGGYPVLPLGEALERMARHDLPPAAVAVTFDDGSADLYRSGWPVLKEFEIPAMVYYTTFYAQAGRPIFNLVGCYLLWKRMGRSIDLHDLTGHRFDLPDDVAVFRAWATIRDDANARGLTHDQKHLLIRALAERVGVDYEELVRQRLLQIMRPEQMREMVEGGIDVGLHTHRHRTPLDRELFRKEILDNGQRIEEWTGRRAQHFCYPEGDAKPEFVPWLRELGVRSATTCATGHASASLDPLLLPRFVDTMTQSEVEFRSWVSGTAGLLPKRGR